MDPDPGLPGRTDDTKRRAMLNIRSETPKPDFELEAEWRSASDSIENTFKPAIGKLERELAERLRDLPPPADSKARTEYDNDMVELRRTANKEHRQPLSHASAKSDGGPLGRKWMRSGLGF